jgi:hypothetical protein
MQISLRSHSFRITSPFGAGHVLTAGEAQALNALRAENIRNSLGKKLNGRDLTPQVLEELIAWLAAYDKSYQFKDRAQKTASPTDSKWDIGREALLIAREAVERDWRENEADIDSEANREIFVQQVEELAKSAEIIAEAIKRIEGKKEVARRALEELLGESESSESSTS